jgi:hypothetical protein
VGGVEAYLCRAAICRVHSGPGSCGAGEGRIPTHPNHWAPLSWVTHDPTWNAPRPRRHCSKLPVRLCPKPSYKFRWAVSVYTKHTRARARTHTHVHSHTHTHAHTETQPTHPRAHRRREIWRWRCTGTAFTCGTEEWRLWKAAYGRSTTPSTPPTATATMRRPTSSTFLPRRGVRVRRDAIRGGLIG